MPNEVSQPYLRFKRSLCDEWGRLFETGATIAIASMLGPLLPLEWMLRRGLDEADRSGEGFFVATSYVLSRLGNQLLAEIPAAEIKLRLADWVSWRGFRLHIGTRFLGAGDWSGISSSVMDSPVMREAYEILGKDLSYQSIPAYAHYLERAKTGKPVRRNNVVLSSVELIDAYFQRFVDLFRSIQMHGILRRKDYFRYAELSRSSCIRRLRAEWGEKEIGIAIGAEGQVYRLPGGQHRVAIAMAIGLGTLPVQVRLVHSEWALNQWKNHGGNLSDAIVSGIRCVAKG
jgi:hypothetical protein